jgi:hypothetical protein
LTVAERLLNRRPSKAPPCLVDALLFGVVASATFRLLAVTCELLSLYIWVAVETLALLTSVVTRAAAVAVKVNSYSSCLGADCEASYHGIGYRC